MTGALLASVLLAAAAVADDGAEPRPARAATAGEVRAALVEATDWLVANQHEDGGWGSHHSARPIEVFCSVPGSHRAFREGTTALCVMALGDLPAELRDRPDVAEARRRGLEHLAAHADVKRMSGLEHYNVWALGYGLQAIGFELARTDGVVVGDALEADLRATARHLVRRLASQQALDGGWGYLSLVVLETRRPADSSMSFTTATVLLGLRAVLDAGVDVPEDMLDRGARSVASCRTPVGAFTYGPYWNRIPANGINLATGGACRTPACLLGLEAGGLEVERDEKERALRWLGTEHAALQRASLRRPIPHESWHAISGYFYLYGHAYAARLLEGLPREARARLAGPLARGVLVTRQPGGAFWDYPLYSYHEAYGTGYAVLALARLVDDLP